MRFSEELLLTVIIIPNNIASAAGQSGQGLSAVLSARMLDVRSRRGSGQDAG
jgi:hypothetical protein